MASQESIERMERRLRQEDEAFQKFIERMERRLRQEDEAFQKFIESMERRRRQEDEAFQKATEEYGLFHDNEEFSRILWDFSYQENHSSGFNDVNTGYADLLSLMERLDRARDLNE